MAQDMDGKIIDKIYVEFSNDNSPAVQFPRNKSEHIDDVACL